MDKRRYNEYMRVYSKARRARLKKLGKCECGGDSEPGKTKCSTCLKHLRERNLLRKKRFARNGRCRCGKLFLPGKRSCRSCAASQRKRLRALNVGIRNEARKRYGSACRCCGEENRAFLTIDHINNDGASHRREVGVGMSFLLWLRKNNFPKGFQTLCFNCNIGRHLNSGICPHRLLAAGTISS